MGYKIIVKVKDGNLEKALKEYKRKFQSQKIGDECRERKEFVKPSLKKRLQLNKAKYKNKNIL
jgi:small subunit ribosomal protein S21